MNRSTFVAAAVAAVLLPFASPSNLTNAETLARLYERTGGSIGDILQFLADEAQRAIDSDRPFLSL